MAGTKIGGQRAAATNKAKYGEDFYRKVGAKGGAASGTGGFYKNPKLAREAGRLGGLKSKRGKADRYTLNNDEWPEVFSFDTGLAPPYYKKPKKHWWQLW